jgi:drug/metabolite transporter (DMT)-like permease
MTARMQRKMGSAEWLMLVVLSILWGGTFFFVAIALIDLPPFTLVFLRVSLGATALAAVSAVLGFRLPTSARLWAGFLTMGALNNVVPFSLIFWSQTQIPSGLASILNATTPLFAVLFAHLLTVDERLTPERLAGVLLGLAGVTAMTGVEALDGFGLAVLAQLAMLGSSMLYALGGLFGRRFRDVPPMAAATGQLTCAAMLMLPIALIADRPWDLPVPAPATWLAVAGLALLSTALAFTLYFHILATAGATNLLLVTFLIPVSALILGTAILGERLEPRHFAGLALIAAGLAVIDGRPVTWLRRQSWNMK